ncbi:hypothetical protein MKX01_039349 [Papaver californicum]|nr:hypothetical protein MKX01_039349 [Papaver californicum]
MGLLGINNPSNSQQLIKNISMAPLISNYNDRIRPLLDAIDKLNHLQVLNGGIQLPTIVVVGFFICPESQGIRSRVPLIMRLHPKLQLRVLRKGGDTDKAHISEAIPSATEEIAGNGKCISNTPLTLVVNKKGVPDLTMVDLPGITRVPVHCQPEDIYEQINNIIMESIVPKESIILNVLSAVVDLLMRQVRELWLIVTKVDKSHEGLQEKVLADDVNTGLTYELFHSHPLLSKMDKSIVGVHFLPEIVKKINEKLNKNAAELNNMPRHLSSITDVITAFIRILGSAKGNDVKMHCTAHLAEILDGFSADLETKSAWNSNKDKCLEDEMKVLGETKGIELPNFLPRTAFQTILQRRIDAVAESPTEFLEKAWNYVEDIFVCVLMMKSESYPQLQTQSTERVKETVLMEKMTDYSCSPDYITTWQRDYLFEMLCEVEFGQPQIVEQAFDIKMRIMAYRNIVMRRLVNSLALHLKLMSGPGGGGIERMLEESPSVVTKHEKLNRSIKLLRESKDVG